ncbi:hypothetical protein GGR52DRAFT_76138 [Hypoxylon sp. FL1284]|nr:hypothetical protein GGR52DRAFT_76138 [Hypoxylon sp. FL1284]
MAFRQQENWLPGSPRLRPGSEGSKGSHGGAAGSASERSSGSRSVLSRVIGSFRQNKPQQQQRNEKKPKTTATTTSGTDDDWMASYKITHHPDRPRVDKRTARERSNQEYAAEIRRMQERSQRHYELSHPGGPGIVGYDRNLTRTRTRTPSPPPPPPIPPLRKPPEQMVQAPPNSGRSYGLYPRSRTAENSRRLPYSDPAPPIREARGPSPPAGNQRRARPRQQQQRDWAPPRPPRPSSVQSPGAMTIQVYRESAVEGEEEQEQEQPPLLPRKTYDPHARARAQTTRDSGYARTASESSSSSSSSVDSQAAAAVAALRMSAAVAHRPSPPTSMSSAPWSSPFGPPPHAPPSYPLPHPTRPLNNADSDDEDEDDDEARTCVMPGCGAALLSTRDREQNVCGPCLKQYRQSTFDAAASSFSSLLSRTPAPVPPASSDLATLAALVGTAGLVDRSHDEENTCVTPLEERRRGCPPARLLLNPARSNFGSHAFRLQPAPPGRKRQQQRQRQPMRLDGYGGGVSTPVAPVSAWSYSTSGVSSRGVVDQQQQQQQQQQHVAYQDGRLQQSSRKLWNEPQPPAPASASSSWTSETPPKSSRSEDADDNDDATVIDPSPLSEDFDEENLRIAPLVPAGARVPPPSPPRESDSWSSAGRYPVRATVLYQDIDDIIDIYVQANKDGCGGEAERRRAEAVASYYEREPEEVEMRRKGYI